MHQTCPLYYKELNASRVKILGKNFKTFLTKSAKQKYVYSTKAFSSPSKIYELKATKKYEGGKTLNGYLLFFMFIYWYNSLADGRVAIDYYR